MTYVVPTNISSVGESIEQYIKNQRSEPRWSLVNTNLGVTLEDLTNNFEFLNGAVLNRYGDKEKQDLLLTTTGLLGPIRTGRRVHFDMEKDNVLVVSDLAPSSSDQTLIDELNHLHSINTDKFPSSSNALKVDGYWTSAVNGAGIKTDSEANVFGETGQLICDNAELKFPLLTYGPDQESRENYQKTLAYYGGKLLSPKEEFCLGFTQDLWGIQYDQKLPEYVTKYQFAANRGGGLFVEHHPFPHIWLPTEKPDPMWQQQTISRIILGRRANSYTEDGYYREVEKQTYHFTMFDVPLDGSALAIRPQCIHNDSFTQGAQTVWLGNTAANTVALRNSAPIQQMSAGNQVFK